MIVEVQLVATGIGSLLLGVLPRDPLALRVPTGDCAVSRVAGWARRALRGALGGAVSVAIRAGVGRSCGGLDLDRGDSERRAEADG
ncbi:hypothetical protein PC128_g11125 [Phytophthora cactorum]|nr:hypothetical protein PC128_g11125 [Phytophthora cactorum]